MKKRSLRLLLVMVPLAALQRQVTITEKQSRELTEAVSAHMTSHMTIDSLKSSAATAAAKKLYVPAYGTEMMAQIIFSLAQTRPEAQQDTPL